MNSKEALELAILEYEKYLETDENNQWVKNVLKGLKEINQDLECLEIERQAYKNLKELYDIDTKSLLQQNEKLKKEKEEIKQWVINKIKYLDKGVFLMSYERVKGAIEILNELLKEVLGNEIF